MAKKLILLAMAVGALVAFAVPAVASAATFEDSSGPVEAGATITAKSTNTVTTVQSPVALTCSEVMLEGTALGSGTNIVGLEGTGTATGCVTEPFGAPTTITSIEEAVNFETSTAGFEFVYDSEALGAENCSLFGEVGSNWTIGTDVIDVSGGPLGGSGAGCSPGAEGIEGSFTATTPNGDPITRTS